MKAITIVILGFIFGLGLIVSGMTNPDKVLNFLTFGNQWDGSLIIVMAVAMLIMMLTWQWVAKKEKPLFAEKLTLSDLKKIDSKLVIGSVLFGLGWGLSGICPGPGLVQLVSLKMEFWLFFAAVLGGMWLAKKV
ncbi:MAG TPA: transporter [Colwellia sp.]|nr:transporter [Colwellia sp.]